MLKYKDYFPIVEYYKKVVQPVNPSHYRIKSDKMMVCPLHDDINPSMGVMNSKGDKELFHCFGCNQWGDVVDLHIRVSRKLFKKYLSEEEAIKDLCRIFNVPFEKFEKELNMATLDADIKQEIALRDNMGKFDISDFREMYIKGKLNKKSVAYFNTITMMMVNELKNG